MRVYANVDSADAYAAKVERLGGEMIVPRNGDRGAGIRIVMFLNPVNNPTGCVETVSA